VLVVQPKKASTIASQFGGAARSRRSSPLRHRIKEVGGMAQTELRGVKRVEWAFVLKVAIDI
jgi:hypothetical protein